MYRDLINERIIVAIKQRSAINVVASKECPSHPGVTAERQSSKILLTLVVHLWRNSCRPQFDWLKCNFYGQRTNHSGN